MHLGGQSFLLSPWYPVALFGAGKQRLLHTDVEFAALNRWHITSWHLESSAAGQLSQTPAFCCSGRSFQGRLWDFPGNGIFSLSPCGKQTKLLYLSVHLVMYRAHRSSLSRDSSL